MLTDKDRQYIIEAGRECLLDIVFESEYLKDKLTFKEHVDLANYVTEIPYEEIVRLIFTEDIKEFESKFKKFLKYGFAAIVSLGGALTAGSIGGALIAPAIGMFVLYLFRKITDTCSRKCVGIPFSGRRKSCMIDCKVKACRDIVNELRTEITKCDRMPNPEKCQNKLQKQYIKWSKKLQELIIKQRQIRADVTEKEREKRMKEMISLATDLSTRLNIRKYQLLEIISNDKIIRESFSFKDHLLLYNAVSKINEQAIVEPPKIDPQKEKLVRTVLYLGLWPIPIPFFNDVINYIIKKYNFACMGKCIQQKQYSQKLCYRQCTYLSAKYAVTLLNKQLSKCNKAKKPKKCRDRIFDLLKDWKQRETEAKIKLDGAIRSEKIRFQRILARQRGD